MKNPFSRAAEGEKRHEIAAKWVMEADAGLSPSQQDALHEWLAEDPRNREAFTAYSGVWGEFDRLAGLHETTPCRFDHDILKQRSSPWKWRRPIVTLCGAALAASVLLVLLLRPSPVASGHMTPPRAEYLQRLQQLTFEDGSTCELKRGSEVEVAYTEGERRVRLLHGEAVFSVETDAQRPFRVEVGSLEVEALGTVFNVRAGSRQVDVIVTEGRVQLRNDPGVQFGEVAGTERARISSDAAVVETLEQASISKAGGIVTVKIAPLDEAAVERALVWRPKRLEFVDAPLSVIVNEFNRRNEVQIVLGSDDLSKIRITSYFWSDDVEAFVRLLERGFNTRVMWSDENRIVINHSM